MYAWTCAHVCMCPRVHVCVDMCTRIHVYTCTVIFRSADQLSRWICKFFSVRGEIPCDTKNYKRRKKKTTVQGKIDQSLGYAMASAAHHETARAPWHSTSGDADKGGSSWPAPQFHGWCLPRILMPLPWACISQNLNGHSVAVSGHQVEETQEWRYACLSGWAIGHSKPIVPVSTKRSRAVRSLFRPSMHNDFTQGQ